MDGIIPLFFLPPNYTGKDGAAKTIKDFQVQQEDEEHKASEEATDRETEELEVDAVEDEASDEDDSEDEASALQQSSTKVTNGVVNAFSLLDSDSSDDSDSD